MVKNETCNFCGSKIEILYCPYCGSDDVSRIFYGLPRFTKEFEKSLKNRDISLGGCCISKNDPEYHCHECEEEFGITIHLDEKEKHITKISNCDELIKKFCGDAISAIERYDRELLYRLDNKAVKEFNKGYWRGIGIYSITEPIIKWIIFSKLCHKYRMYPECSAFYSDKKLLDLAIYLKDEYDEKTPDIAIEMKWATFRVDGRPSSFWLNQMINDVTKLYQEKKSSNKYFIQFAFMTREEWFNMGTKIEKTINDFNNSSKERKFKNGKISFLTKKRFITRNAADKPIIFAMLVWKIEKVK